MLVVFVRLVRSVALGMCRPCRPALLPDCVCCETVRVLAAQTSCTTCCISTVLRHKCMHSASVGYKQQKEEIGSVNHQVDQKNITVVFSQHALLEKLKCFLCRMGVTTDHSSFGLQRFM